VFSEELAQLVEGNRHRHHLPSSLPHLALLNGACPKDSKANKKRGKSTGEEKGKRMPSDAQS